MTRACPSRLSSSCLQRRRCCFHAGRLPGQTQLFPLEVLAVVHGAGLQRYHQVLSSRGGKDRQIRSRRSHFSPCCEETKLVWRGCLIQSSMLSCITITTTTQTAHPSIKLRIRV